MKKIIISLNEQIPENIIDDFVNTGAENGITDFLVDDLHFLKKITKVEHVNVYSRKIDFNPKFLIIDMPTEVKIQSKLEESSKSNYMVGIHHRLSNKEDEKSIITIAKSYPDIAFIIVEISKTEQKVLPFENLIAELLSVDIMLYAQVDSVIDTELMTKILEVGVDGIVFTPTQIEDITYLNRLTGDIPTFELNDAQLIDIKTISKADRVCVDTTSLLTKNEGMLVGSTAKGFALIQAEVTQNEFVTSRPFRINAGDVSAYTLVPSFDEKGDFQTKTKYLSEIQAGDDVIIVNTNGSMRIVTVGRVKIETRPMLLLNFEIFDEKQPIPMNVILQNAETVHLIQPDGNLLSVTKLKRGDKILSYIGPGATHFGTPIKETIIEK